MKSKRSSGNNRAWSTPEVEKLKALLADGLFLRQIAAKFAPHRNYLSIQHKCQSLGLKINPDPHSSLHNPWPEADIEKLRDLASKGFSGSQIMRQLNGIGSRYTRSAVVGKANRLGITLNGNVQRILNHRIEAKKRTPKSTIADVPLEVPQAIGSQLFEVASGCCQYPVNGITCGHPASRNLLGKKTPYCAYHRTIVYVPMTVRNNAFAKTKTSDTRTLRIPA